MKEALKKKKVYIQLIVYSCILLAGFVTILILFYGNGIDVNASFNSDMVYLLTAVVLFAIGFLSSDISINRYRRKSKNWADKVPKEVRQHAWDLRTPWYLSSLLAFCLTIILGILL